MARALSRSGPWLWLCAALASALALAQAQARGRGALSDAAVFRLPTHARIFGGVNASSHEFPSQVYIVSLLQTGHEPPSGLFCGGTILNEKWILTAAHCVKHSIRTVFGYGTANKQRLEYQVAARVIPHEDYVLFGRNENNADNDVGLVEASERLPLDGRAVAAARLPLPAPDPHRPPAPPRGRGVVVTGWGRWTYDALQAHPGSTAVLKKLDVHIFPCPGDVSNVICIQTDAGTGICDGDSGGPLMMNGDFYGVASYVDNMDDDPTLDPNLHCNEVGSWAVYMSVQAYRPWIQRHTGI